MHRGYRKFRRKRIRKKPTNKKTSAVWREIMLKNKKQPKTVPPGQSGDNSPKETAPAALPLRHPLKPEDIISLARECGGACIEALLDEVENGKGAARIAAARELLERGYGKARQPLEVSGGLEVKLEVPEEISLFLSGLH